MEREPHYPGTMPQDPRADVWLPANLLLFVAFANGLLYIALLVLSLTGAGFQILDGRAPQALIGGTTALLNSLVGLALASLIAVGAVKMKRLESWPLSLLASIVAMVPCTSPCCFLGIPIGIWSMMVLFSPEVKRAFRS